MPDETSNLKEVHYYAQCVSAWFKTKLERDKSILTLSTGGIGLLVTLMTTLGISSGISLVLYVLSLGGFIICMITVLFIFNGNATYLEKITGKEEPSSWLAVLDKVAMCSFIFALTMTSIWGVYNAAGSTSRGEMNMTSTKTTDSSANAAAVGPKSSDVSQSVERATGSFDNVQSMGPNLSSHQAVNPELVRSYSGAQNMKPSTQQGGSQPATSGPDFLSSPQGTGTSTKK